MGDFRKFLENEMGRMGADPSPDEQLALLAKQLEIPTEALGQSDINPDAFKSQYGHAAFAPYNSLSHFLRDSRPFYDKIERIEANRLQAAGGWSD